jgi:hypothetical protein
MRYNLNNNMVLLPTTYHLPPTQGGQAPLEIRNLRFLPRLARGSLTGQAVLSLILTIGVIIVMIALSLAFLASSFVNSAYGFRIAQRAEAVASSGAADGLMQLLRNKDFVPTPNPYTVSVGSDSAAVKVDQNLPVAGEVTITSTATILFRTRTITVVVSRNSTSSLITLISKTQS